MGDLADGIVGSADECAPVLHYKLGDVGNILWHRPKRQHVAGVVAPLLDAETDVL